MGHGVRGVPPNYQMKWKMHIVYISPGGEEDKQNGRIMTRQEKWAVVSMVAPTKRWSEKWNKIKKRLKKKKKKLREAHNLLGFVSYYEKQQVRFEYTQKSGWFVEAGNLKKKELQRIRDLIVLHARWLDDRDAQHFFLLFHAAPFAGVSPSLLFLLLLSSRICQPHGARKTKRKIEKKEQRYDKKKKEYLIF